MKCKHSYATQRLKENKFKIYANSRRILQYPFKEDGHWDVPKVETRIQIGLPFLVGNIHKTRVITDYEDLMRSGMMISKRSPRLQRFPGQKREYFITKLSQFNPNVPNIGLIPDNHYIERNPRTNEFKLVGDNSDGVWYNHHPRIHRDFQTRRSPFDQRGREGYFDAIKKYLPMQEEEITYSDIIPEIVLGITEDGKIVCIQEEKENPTIGIPGKKRHCKSIIKHKILDGTYHKWKKKCVELNDVMMETDSYCQTWKPIKIWSNLDLINEVSIPLPMVYLHPKTRTLKNMIAKDETGFEVYWDYCEFIQDLNNIMKGKEEWNLKGSAKYLRNLLFDSEGEFAKDGLYYCKSYKEQEAVVYKKLYESKEDDRIKKSQSKIPEAVAPTILNLLKDVDNAKILDISNNTKAKWTVEYPDGHKEKHYPWTACIIADLVPSIVTHNLKNYHRDFHPQYANFILNDLFRNQNDNELFIKNKTELFIFFDEILSLVHSKEAVDTMEMVVRESGHSRIGFTFCTQFWDKVPEFIRSQTDYVISFNQTKSQAKAIAEDFGEMRYKQKELVNLQKGEFMIFSSNPIILYDEYGKREEKRDVAIKATVFPPLSAHKAPKSVGA